MRMDGGAVLACKTPMKPLVDAGDVPVISPMGNLPVIKDLVVDMEPFWEKFRAIKPYLEDGDDDPPVKEWRIQQEELDRIMKEALCIQCGCCVSECNSMEADPDFLGPAALAKAARFVYDVRDRGAQGAAAHATTASTACGTAPAATSARSAAPRASTRATRSPRWAPRSTRRACTTTAARATPRCSMSRRKTGYLLETALVPETVGRSRRSGHPVRDEDGPAGQGAQPASSRTGPRSSTRSAS